MGKRALALDGRESQLIATTTGVVKLILCRSQFESN